MGKINYPFIKQIIYHEYINELKYIVLEKFLGNM